MKNQFRRNLATGMIEQAHDGGWRALVKIGTIVAKYVDPASKKYVEEVRPRIVQVPMGAQAKAGAEPVLAADVWVHHPEAVIVDWAPYESAPIPAGGGTWGKEHAAPKAKKAAPAEPSK